MATRRGEQTPAPDDARGAENLRRARTASPSALIERRCNILRVGERRAPIEGENTARVRAWDEPELVQAIRTSCVSSSSARGGLVLGFNAPARGAAASPAASPAKLDIRQSVHKVARQKGVSSGRTYTSKYRGVHQTFPTGRWEAQFRRNGKPTSLGCFDHEEEAAKAYDRMMLWCEIHAAELTHTVSSPQKQGAVALNFDVSTYDGDMHALEFMSQDDLMQELRRLGRVQATGALAPL